VTAALLCLFLLTIEPFLSRPGQLFAVWITAYPPARFLLEMIRTDESPFAGTGLSVSQNVSLLVAVLAVGYWVYLWAQRPDKLKKTA
jgi:prolipoprotein diacylglyceryltransferase